MTHLNLQVIGVLGTWMRSPDSLKNRPVGFGMHKPQFALWGCPLIKARSTGLSPQACHGWGGFETEPPEVGLKAVLSASRRGCG